MNIPDEADDLTLQGHITHTPGAASTTSAGCSVQDVKARMEKVMKEQHESDKRLAAALLKAGFTLISCPHLRRYDLCVSEELAKAAREVRLEQSREAVERLREVFKPQGE